MLGTCKLSIILPRQHTAGLGEPEVDLRLVELNPIPCDTGGSLTPRPNNRVTPKGMLKGYFLVSTTRSAWPARDSSIAKNMGIARSRVHLLLDRAGTQLSAARRY